MAASQIWLWIKILLFITQSTTSEWIRVNSADPPNNDEQRVIAYDSDNDIVWLLGGEQFSALPSPSHRGLCRVHQIGVEQIDTWQRREDFCHWNQCLTRQNARVLLVLPSRPHLKSTPIVERMSCGWLHQHTNADAVSCLDGFQCRCCCCCA